MDALLDIIGSLSEWVWLAFTAQLVFFLGMFFFGKLRLTEMLGYVGAFAVGLVALHALSSPFDSHAGITICTSPNPYVTSCNGWTSFAGGVSQWMQRFSEWIEDLKGALGLSFGGLVVAFIAYGEMSRNVLGRGRDVLSAFVVTAFVLLTIMYSGYGMKAINGMVSFAFSPFGTDPVAAAEQAGEKIQAYYGFLDQLDKMSALDTAIETLTNKDSFTSKWMTASVGKGVLYWVSLFNLLFFIVQTFLVSFLPTMVLFSYLLDTFTVRKPLTFMVFAGVMSIASTLQVYLLRGLPDLEGASVGTALGQFGDFVVLALVLAGVQTVFGAKVLLMILMREMMPAMRQIRVGRS